MLGPKHVLHYQMTRPPITSLLTILQIAFDQDMFFNSHIKQISRITLCHKHYITNIRHVHYITFFTLILLIVQKIAIFTMAMHLCTPSVFLNLCFLFGLILKINFRVSKNWSKITCTCSWTNLILRFPPRNSLLIPLSC